MKLYTFTLNSYTLSEATASKYTFTVSSYTFTLASKNTLLSSCQLWVKQEDVSTFSFTLWVKLYQSTKYTFTLSSYTLAILLLLVLCCFAALLFCCLAALLLCCFAALLLRCSAALLLCCSAALLPCCSVAFLLCCCAASPYKKLTKTQACQKSSKTQHASQLCPQRHQISFSLFVLQYWFTFFKPKNMKKKEISYWMNWVWCKIKMLVEGSLLHVELLRAIWIVWVKMFVFI